MDGAQFEFEADVWLHQGEAAWHFVTVPGDISDEIRARTALDGRAFGTVPATVSIGKTSWSTSLFTDTQRDAYLIPIKAQVRRAEQLADGDVARLTVTLDDDR